MRIVARQEMVALYSVDLYNDNFNSSRDILEVLGGYKTTFIQIGNTLIPQKTRANPVCYLNAT